MITLQIINPHWIQCSMDDPEDHCSHGAVQFTVESTVYISPADGDWTTSAAGLFLLRTIDSDHTPENSVAENNFLIPCCGHCVWPAENHRYACSILGCNTGINPELRHSNGKVHLKLHEKESVVDLKAWVLAVLGFIQQVESFYENCTPKAAIQEDLDRQGWNAFWQEWQQRKKLAEEITK